MVPLLWAALAYLIVAIVVAGIGERLGERFAAAVGGSTAAGGAVGAATGLVLTVVLGGSIYLALVALISGFGFDRLSAEVEERAFGRVAGHPLGFAAGLVDGIPRATLAVALGLAGLCLSGTIVAPWLIASLLAVLDATAPALRRRDVGLSRQIGAVRRLPGALPFALVAGVVVLIPIVNVLCLPILVVAGTILVNEVEH